jgi:hypothetical protein
VDLVLVMDDTGTMGSSCTRNGDGTITGVQVNCPVYNAREGAKALVNLLFSIPDSNAKVSVVPFRGCYASSRLVPSGATNGNINDGCVLFSEILNLTDDATTITNNINSINAEGGYPGTNICLGMHEARARLFGAGARALARKVMVVLTDGDNRYSDGAQSSLRGNSPDPDPSSTDNTNDGPWAPPVYPPPLWPSDNSPAAHDCRVPSPKQNSTDYGSGDYDPRANNLDVRTENKANTLKDPDGDNVEIFVLRFAAPAGDLSSSTPCNPAQIGAAGVARDNPNEARDQNLSRCLASNTVLGDHYSTSTNDHYFYAATPADIIVQFQAIATELLKLLRLVT